VIPVLQQLYSGLEERRQRMLGRIREMSEAQSSFREEPKAWTPIQVAQHVAIAEQVGVDAMVHLKDRPSKPRRLAQRLGYAAVWVILKLGLRVKSPARRTIPDGEVSLTELEPEWDRVRQRLSDFLETLDERALSTAGFMHPVAGPLNLHEALVFMTRHLDHHLRQLDRIATSKNFPGGP